MGGMVGTVGGLAIENGLLNNGARSWEAQWSVRLKQPLLLRTMFKDASVGGLGGPTGENRKSVGSEMKIFFFCLWAPSP